MGLFSRTRPPPPIVKSVELNNSAPPIVRISNITVAEAQRLSENNANILVKLERPSASKSAANDIAGIHNSATRVSGEKEKYDEKPTGIDIKQLWGVAAVATAVDTSAEHKRFSRESQIQKALQDAAEAAAAAAGDTNVPFPAADGPKRSSRESQPASTDQRKSGRQSHQNGPHFDAEAVAAAIHAPLPANGSAKRSSKEQPVDGLAAGDVPRLSSKRESAQARTSGRTSTRTSMRTSRQGEIPQPVTVEARPRRPYIPIHLLQPTTAEIEQARALRLKTARETDERSKNDIRRRSIDILRKCDFLCINAGNAGRHTIHQLGEQTERLERMIGGLDEIGRDLGEAEQNLGNLSTWCCGLFTKRNDEDALGPEDEAELNTIEALKTLKGGSGGNEDDDDSESDDDIMAAATKQQKLLAGGNPANSKQQQALSKLAKASQQHHLKHHKSHKVKIIRDTAAANISDPLELEVCDTLMNLYIQVDHLELETKTMNEALQAREDQINRAVGKVERNVTRLQGAIKHGQSLLQ